MKKKSLFALLLSGAMLSPIAVYAMDDTEALTSPTIRGLKFSPGESLKRDGDHWTNNAGTIMIPAIIRTGPETTDVNGIFASVEGNLEDMYRVGDDGLPYTRMPFWDGTRLGEWRTELFKAGNYIFEITKDHAHAYPILRRTQTPSAAPAPALRPELETQQPGAFSPYSGGGDPASAPTLPPDFRREERVHTLMPKWN